MIEKIKIVGISGSLRNGSVNTSVLKAIGSLASVNVDFSLFDRLDTVPYFRPELDTNEAPDAVREFRSLIRSADGIIISTPEYAFGVPGVLKNALDWMASTTELMNKPVATISASPSYMGGDKAHASLLLTLTALSAKVVEGGSLTIASVKTKLDANGKITDDATVRSLNELLRALTHDISRELPA